MVLKNLGLMGKMGSGKGFAARYLAKKYNYKVITMGNFVRTLARKEKIKPTRENLEKLQKKYSKIYRHDYVIEKVIEKAKTMRGPLLLDGIRKPLQAKLAKKNLGTVLIEIYAAPKIRFERMKRRGRKSDSNAFEEFKKIEAQEDKIFGINKTLRMADFKINNDDGKQGLYSDLDKIIRSLR